MKAGCRNIISKELEPEDDARNNISKEFEPVDGIISFIRNYSRVSAGILLKRNDFCMTAWKFFLRIDCRMTACTGMFFLRNESRMTAGILVLTGKPACQQENCAWKCVALLITEGIFLRKLEPDDGRYKC